MLLGENGVGKSSFLQAMALTLVGKDYLSGLKIKAGKILKHGKSSGFVKIYHRQSKEPISITFSRRTNKIISNYQHPGSYLLAYGSTRLFPTTILKEEVIAEKIKVKNMFSPDVALADSRKFILDIYKRSKSKTKSSKKYKDLFNRIGLAVKDLLLLKGKEQLKVLNGEVYIDYGNKKRDTLDELSDGYKSIMALGIDIIKTLWKDNALFATAQGIVLLDEIGTHLHPRWRMQVVKKMRNAFPALQFIVTTHDPLCLRGLKKGEVVVFDKDENNRVFIIDDLPDSSEYRVDQLLTSPFFGLNSVVDPDLEKEFNRYYFLLRKAQPADEEKAEISRLKEKLEPKLHLGGSYREELIYKAVDEVIANSTIKTPVQFMVNPQKGNAENISIQPGKKSASEARNKAEEEVKARVRELLKIETV
jgi:AAA15 family ATPase/GTPase